MRNEGFQVTFGVEVEAILAFHESALQAHLNATGTACTIVKDLPEDSRRDLCIAQPEYLLSRPKYMGWGLTAPTNYTTSHSEHKFQRHFDDNIHKHGCRGYGGEILQLAHKILPQGVHIHDSFTEKFNNFNSWHITHERSLVGVNKSTLAHEFAISGRPKTTTELEEWDTHGIELVSRVLSYQPSSFNEINTHLQSLSGTKDSNHMAFTTEHCGLHVHIGLPTPPDLEPGTPPPTFSLATLQHLAYLLVIYEKAISTLHPPHRRENSPASLIDLQTNLDNFIEEPTYDLSDWDDDADDNIPTTEDEPPPLSFSTARAKIFSPHMTLPALASLMCGKSKGHIVNWSYLERTKGLARTLEFRQHAGELRGEEVKCK
ncbi:hypothetical protein JMJ35_006544 [Cladonia borealis]|uniref:Amidoligase n=1 Tax=Cladonia borealis TaxID=184061 RepID=A0AA39QXD3_9LECA|nr:hypothetical protein JMJ35_006544 [Cladonia borealis]